MELKFQVHIKIQKPVSEVFDAVYNPKKLSGYFTTGGASGPLDEGKLVIWHFADFPGDVPVSVKKVVRDQRIVFEWEASDQTESVLDKHELPTGAGYNTTVEITFETLKPGETLVKIAEGNWRETPGGLKSSYGNCMGWTQMVCALKAYVEHGINLRKGAF